jgi:hypothetical protein
LTWTRQRAATEARKGRSITPESAGADLHKPILRVVVYPSLETEFRLLITRYNSAIMILLGDAERTVWIEPSGLTYDQELKGLVAKFDLTSVGDIRGPDHSNEFFVRVMGANLQKDFRVKKEHFDRIPYRLPTR